MRRAANPPIAGRAAKPALERARKVGSVLEAVGKSDLGYGATIVARVGEVGRGLLQPAAPDMGGDRAADLTDPRYNGRAVSQIAFANGFEDAAHFSRAFKGRFGRTPRDWRVGGAAH